MNLLPVLPLLVPLATLGLLILCAGVRPFIRQGLQLLGSSALFAVSTVLWFAVWREGTQICRLGGWPSPAGIAFVVDLLGASMVWITGFVGFCLSIFLFSEERPPGARYLASVQAVLMGVAGSFLSGDLFNLFVWFEVMLMGSFVLMAFEGTREQLDGALKYTVMNLVSSILFLSAVGILYGASGTLNMADLSLRSESGMNPLLVKVAFALLLAAFGVKAGVFPLFFWLPASYHTPRTATSALLAGLLTKVGVYALIRLTTLLFPSMREEVQPLLIVVACLTMITGVLGAASQFDIRRILSFHIISQIGYMILALALWTPVALAAAVFYVIHHIVVKTNLFLIGGAIERLRGSSDLKRLGGLSRAQPGLAVLFLIPALSLAGLPPLSGFFAKLAVIRAGFEAREYIAIGVALVVGLLTLFSMMKIWIEAFWKPAPAGGDSADRAPEKIPVSMLIPVALMAAVTLIFGLWPQILFEPADRISRELLDPTLYIRSVLEAP